MSSDAAYIASGTINTYQWDGTCIPVEAPFAIGSEAHYAIGAMMAGATPRDAVKIAADRDVCTGGEIISMSLKPSAFLHANESPE